MAQKKKNWIKSAIGRPGLLHKQLGIPMGQKIPPSKLAALAKSGGKNAKRARLALTLERVNKGKKRKKK